ncbi:hypothetical protein HMPREF1981_01624 [Bacteroides pyogenes F0041]|uniref:Uncharacterized protein n=1 Tax=Bacteroides pyogenes F0041 TaxID=1321819 RepID=U2E011_9BACE|nr:hypothetical protein HMPREF1981_01624 [Bacteroides pyogenes F0041]
MPKPNSKGVKQMSKFYKYSFFLARFKKNLYIVPKFLILTF